MNIFPPHVIANFFYVIYVQKDQWIKLWVPDWKEKNSRVISRAFFQLEILIFITNYGLS